MIKDDIKRRAFEEEFTSLISGKERTGIASYTLMPDLQSTDEKEEILAVETRKARLTRSTFSSVPGPLFRPRIPAFKWRIKALYFLNEYETHYSIGRL